ncbi:MAG: hypothetical protein QNJ65_06310 [Xenococcaceae cyanobacterium MO_234.B1]|nr:hypothetical protein [Xenococcaceae cyanobacterium MO_234.B1]
MFAPKEKPLPTPVLKPLQANNTPLIEGEGIHLGEGYYWNLSALPNGHIVAIGASGSGKTQTLKAIANSPELVTLDEQIALIDKRLTVAGKRIEHTSKKRWTNYISSNPLRIAANLLGGGDVQRDNIAIADLEIKSAELEAYRANLHRRKAEVKSKLREEVLSLVLKYEAAEREYVLAQSKLATYSQQLQLIEIDYQFGNGSTTQMLGLWQQGESLEAEVIQVESKKTEITRKLLQMTGFEANRSRYQTSKLSPKSLTDYPFWVKIRFKK